MRSPRRGGVSCIVTTGSTAMIGHPKSACEAEMSEEEKFEVDKEIVACDGGTGALGHPRVWLNMRGRGGVECPYCGRNYVLKKSAVAAGH